MCGLTGYWQKPGPGAAEMKDLTARMTATLRHRGPNDHGLWCDPAAAIALGHTRLSILDLSAEGHQPMATPDGRFTIAYNGEVYNFEEMRAELESAGHRFRGHCDTEVILHAIQAWGIEQALTRFVGMFAFALWDSRERALFLARDRLGIKPLYWGVQSGTLIFGSELKSCRLHPSFRAQIDRDALALYLRHNYIPEPHSIFQGFHKLPPGCWARFHSPSLPPEIHRFWDVRKVAKAGLQSPFRGTDDEILDGLDGLLRDAVRMRMLADVPLGAFLSGGVDSSTVVALMQAQSPVPVRTFTIGFDEPGYDEAEHARKVAGWLGTDHTELYLDSKDAQAVIPALPELFDEPFADSSQIPTLLVSRMARQHVTVCLSGDGGDELFGGYPRYHFAQKARKRLELVPARMQRAAAGALRTLSPGGWNRLADWSGRAAPRSLRSGKAGDRIHKFADVLASGSTNRFYQSLVSQWDSPGDVVLGATEPATVLLDDSLRRDIPGFLERMMLMDTVSYLPDDILCKVDRASMAVGLEARVPLLDHRVVEYAWRIPRRLRVGGGQGKNALRRILGRYVPPRLFERPKMGFGVPLDTWLRGPLRAWGEELLSRQRLTREGVFDPALIRCAWEEHQSGQRSRPYHLWTVLMFQAWKERWKVAA
jgi:asparagine synthase (glutamine-hydrolysing)